MSDSLPFNDRYSPSIAKVSSGEIRKTEWEKSIKNPQEFWAEKAKAIDWFKAPTKVLDDSNPPFFKWFPDGELNICYNAIDRHIKTARKNKLAYIWEGEMGEVKTYTYYQLYREVNKVAKALKDFGVKKGDRVAVFLPVIPELPISLLAIARIGGVHTVVFSGFSAEALSRPSKRLWSKNPHNRRRLLPQRQTSRNQRQRRPRSTTNAKHRESPRCQTHRPTSPNERRKRRLVPRCIDSSRRKCLR